MKKTNIEEIADKLRIAWNEATHQVGTRWECLSERSRRGYIAVAKAAVECAGEREQYRDLTHEDTIQEGDEVWSWNQGPWVPVSKCEHGQQYRNGYNRMRRPVADSNISSVAEHSELAKWEEACRDRDADIDKLHKKLERIEKATMCLRGFREINSHDPAQCIEDAAAMIQKLTFQNHRLQDDWNKDHMEMKRKLDAAESVRIDWKGHHDSLNRQANAAIEERDKKISYLKEKFSNASTYIEKLEQDLSFYRSISEQLKNHEEMQ